MNATRREFLKQSSALSLGLALPAVAGEGKPRLRVAAVFTAFFFRSHAHDILQNFVAHYLFNGRWITPDTELVSLYADQFPPNDIGRAFAKKFGIPIYPTIAGALCRGGDRLAVDAVLSIGEHGDYPYNEKGQHLYPRKRFFDEIVAVFRRSGRVVPLYNDKHLSYRWDWAKEMYDTAREMGIPLMAASSVPLAQRIPPLEIAPGAPITEAVSIHGGAVESYDYHGLEVLQSIVEFRRGGETGVAQVQFLEGDALWRAAAAGLWSIPLACAALDADGHPGRPPAAELVRPGVKARNGEPFVRHGVLLTYRSGLRAIVLAADTGGSGGWYFGCRVAGESAPRATRFYVGPWGNRNLFMALSHAIQDHFRRGRAPWPIERTLLNSGILDAEMESRFRGGRPIATPQLAIAYAPRDFRAMREMGASWRVLDGTPEPRGIATL